MKWYIGQPIVAIVNHPQGVFKKGDDFVIKGLRNARCKCYDILIDIGRKATTQIGDSVLCPNGCGTSYIKESTWWFSETRFAPLDQDISELTEILEKPISILEKIENTRPNLEQECIELFKKIRR